MWVRSKPRASAIGRCRDRHSSAETRRSASGYLADAADVVLVEMADDGAGHVTGAVAKASEPGRQRLVLADVEPGETAIDHAVRAVGKVRRISDRGSVLSRVEQHHSVGVLDDIDVDRTAFEPASRGEDPPIHGRPASIGVLRVDVDGPRAEAGDAGDAGCHRVPSSLLRIVIRYQ